MHTQNSKGNFDIKVGLIGLGAIGSDVAEKIKDYDVHKSVILVLLTPHIAGSMGNEIHRMAYYMIEELNCYISGKETRYEVTK